MGSHIGTLVFHAYASALVRLLGAVPHDATEWASIKRLLSRVHSYCNSNLFATVALCVWPARLSAEAHFLEGLSEMAVRKIRTSTLPSLYCGPNLMPPEITSSVPADLHRLNERR